jgi:WhiB family transcriptional regulator, redox-sensing transcriptional regulator
VSGTRGSGTRAVHREEWLDAGACRDEDPELFFPITSNGPSARQIDAAKAVCQRCGVLNECLHYALESRQNHGVWGGTSEEERGRMAPAAHAGEPRPAEPRPASRRPANARRPSRRLKSGREGRTVQFRALGGAPERQRPS